jgi:hypothetical protein
VRERSKQEGQNKARSERCDKGHLLRHLRARDRMQPALIPTRYGRCTQSVSHARLRDFDDARDKMQALMMKCRVHAVPGTYPWLLGGMAEQCIRFVRSAPLISGASMFVTAFMKGCGCRPSRTQPHPAGRRPQVAEEGIGGKSG